MHLIRLQRQDGDMLFDHAVGQLGELVLGGLKPAV
jgi:hypothetical protein